MILSSRQTFDQTADVCIVGAGPVGLALAFTLEKKGKTVLLLDAGPSNGSAAPRFLMTSHNQHHASLNQATAAGLGGTTSLWGGRCVSYDDLDFEERDHVPHSRWPIAHDALKTHYKEALEFLDCKVGHLDDGTDRSEGQRISFDALEWWSSEPNLETKYRKSIEDSQLIHFLPEAMVTSLEAISKNGLSVTHLNIVHNGIAQKITGKKVVLACGGIGNARLLHPLADGNALGHLSKTLGRFYQGHLTGYLAVAQLKPEAVKKLSFQTNELGGIFRRRMQVSSPEQRRLKLLNTVFWLDSISISDPIHRSSKLSAIYILLRITGLYHRFGKKKAASSKPRASFSLREHFKNLKPSLKSRDNNTNFLKDIFSANSRRPSLLINSNGRYLLRYHAEQTPDEASQVYQTEPPTQTNAPVLMIDYRFNEADIDSVIRSHECVDRWLRETGTGKLEYLHSSAERRESVLNQAFDGFHQIGLTRMSHSSTDGVVDQNCKVHETDNLYVVGSSVFPTGGQANPTLPAVALAMRLGHHL